MILSTVTTVLNIEIVSWGLSSSLSPNIALGYTDTPLCQDRVWFTQILQLPPHQMMIASIESQYRALLWRWEERADDTWLRLVITEDSANSAGSSCKNIINLTYHKLCEHITNQITVWKIWGGFSQDSLASQLLKVSYWGWGTILNNTTVHCMTNHKVLIKFS